MAFNLFACSNAESFSECQDWATLMLTRIFEDVIPFITGAAQQPTETRFLGEVFIWFNIWLLIIAGMIASYVAIVGTANTANDGQAMGKQWSSLWVPLRVVMAAAALLPTPTGFSILQVMVIALALMGSNAANFINDQALKKVVTPTEFAPELAVTNFSSDGGLITNAFMQGVCAGLYEKYYHRLESGTDGAGGGSVTAPAVVNLLSGPQTQAWYQEERAKYKSRGYASEVVFQIVDHNNKFISDSTAGLKIPLDGNDRSKTWGVGFGTSRDASIAQDINSALGRTYFAVCGSVTASRGEEFRGFNGATDEFVTELRGIREKVETKTHELAASLYSTSGQQNDVVHVGRMFVHKVGESIEGCETPTENSSSDASSSTKVSDVIASMAQSLIAARDDYMSKLHEARATALGCPNPFQQTAGGITDNASGQKCNFDNLFENAMNAQREKASKYGWTAAVGWFHEISAARAAVANNLLPADIESKVPSELTAMGGDRETLCVKQVLAAAADAVSKASLGKIDMALASGTTTSNANEVRQQAQEFTAQKLITTSTAIASAVIRGLSVQPKKDSLGTTDRMSILSNEARTAGEKFRELAFANSNTDSVSNTVYKSVGDYVMGQLAETCPPSLTGIGNSLYRIQCLADIAVQFSLAESVGALADFKIFENAQFIKAGLQAALVGGVSAGIEKATGNKTGSKTGAVVFGAISGNKYLSGVAKNAHSIISPAIFVSVVLPMLPYFVFMFGVLGWVLGILQTVVAAPLWAVLHMTPGQSFIGGERQGYLLMLALAVRPALLIISLYLGFWICDTFIDYYAAGFIKALDAISSTASGVNAYGALGSGVALFTGGTSQLSILFLVFCIGLFAVFGLVFSLAQTLPNAVLRWINVNNEDLGASHGADILKQRMQSAAGVGGYHSAPATQGQQFGRNTSGKDGNPQ